MSQGSSSCHQQSIQLMAEPREKPHIAPIRNSLGERSKEGARRSFWIWILLLSHPRASLGQHQHIIPFSTMTWGNLSVSLLISSLKRRDLFLRQRARKKDCLFAPPVLRTQNSSPGEFCCTLLMQQDKPCKILFHLLQQNLLFFIERYISFSVQ